MAEVEQELAEATPMRAWAIAKAFELGMSVAEVHTNAGVKHLSSFREEYRVQLWPSRLLISNEYGEPFCRAISFQIERADLFMLQYLLRDMFTPGPNRFVVQK